ncbi:hypothetical protein FIV50_04335 [Microbacterium foliorum]|uniref:Uncharacterized protein n=1 Tax=Microbacterium foliorum TaxID=104336 RepID=A0A4Y5YNB6_9MICO|nr:hypothetical protein [Microbacterium foliorum]QDE34088.1 hypothetical protein FIV50_04335 [Microbacterium foliorum]
MLDAEESVELQALQARAYGRAGALSEAEAARLRELEAGRTRRAEPPAPTAAEPRSAHTDPAASSVVEGDGASVSEEAIATGTTRVDSALAALRQHWRLAVAIAAAFAVVGVVLGWLIFADRGPAPMQLTAQQEEWQSAIVASGGFDPGSVRAMTQEEGVVIWFATKNESADVCLVLGHEDVTAPACTTREQARILGVNATLTKPVEQNQNYDVQAQMFLTQDGEPAVITRSYITSPQSSSMFASPEEAEAATTLAEQTGLDRRTIQVVGYDDQVPIWTGIDASTQRYCLVYDGSMPDPPMACDDGQMLADADRTLALDVVDDGETTRYEYQFGYGQQYLTVTRGWESDDAAGE